MAKSKRSFDYAEFYDGYGLVLDAEKYTPEQAIEVYKREYGYSEAKDIDFEIYEIRVKWFPKMSKDDMWHYDIYDSYDNRGIYKVVEDEDIHNDPDNRGFKCLRVRYDEAHKELT